MKKYKIGNKVIYANSLHDALEIYKHKVKDYGEDVPNWFKSLYFEAKDKFNGHEGKMYKYIKSKSSIDYDDFLNWGTKCRRIYEKNLKFVKVNGMTEPSFSWGDSKTKDGRYTRFSGKSKSKQGYEIRGYCMTSEGRMYAVLYRPNVGDYLVAAGYNQQRGDWDQGYYDFKTEEQAVKKAEQLTKMYDSVKDSKVKDKDWADYLRDVLDDENIDYDGIGSDYVTFDNEDDMEDAIFILERQEGRKLRIDKKKLEVKILR